MSSWKDDHGKAVALMDEAKEIARAGFPDGMESQERFKAKMKEADDFLERAKLQKDGDERRAQLLAMDGEAADKAGKQMEQAAAETGNSGVQVIEPKREVATPQGNYIGRKKSNRLHVSRRLAQAWGERLLGVPVDQLEKAALGEASGSTGGYLVVPQYMQELFAGVRRQGNTLLRLGWLNVHNTEASNQVLIPKASGGGSMAIVAELASKPTSDNAYSQLAVQIYTMAGIYNVSKQIADDADPAVMEIVAEDLGSLLGNLEEQKIINGSGTLEPKGILNTSGTAALPSATQTALNGTVTGQVLIEAMIDAIAAVKASYFTDPSGILMRPLRMAFLQKTKDSAGNYLFNSPGSFRAPGVLSQGVNSVSTDTTEATWNFLGMLPVATSSNIPNTLGGSSNADAVIVANWREAHWFVRQEPTVDSSDVAGDAFETNKVKYRLEERAGFTAERFASAFCVVTGTGMTGG